MIGKANLKKGGGGKWNLAKTLITKKDVSLMHKAYQYTGHIIISLDLFFLSFTKQVPIVNTHA